MKTTIRKIVNVYSVLEGAKYTKLKTSERAAIVKFRRPMKKIVMDYEDFRKDALKDLRPDDFDQTVEVIRSFNEMTEEERKEALKDPEYLEALKANADFNRSVDECLKEEEDKEIEVEVAPISREAFNKLLDSNLDWTFGILDVLEEMLCPAEEVAPETEG